MASCGPGPIHPTENVHVLRHSGFLCVPPCTCGVFLHSGESQRVRGYTTGQAVLAPQHRLLLHGDNEAWNSGSGSLGSRISLTSDPLLQAKDASLGVRGKDPQACCSLLT